MNTKSTLLALALGLVAMPAYSGTERDCGAAGDGCAPAEWKAYELAASEQFPTWPEVGIRTYASLCFAASDEIKSLCVWNPAKAAEALELPPKE